MLHTLRFLWVVTALILAIEEYVLAQRTWFKERLGIFDKQIYMIYFAGWLVLILASIVEIYGGRETDSIR